MKNLEKIGKIMEKIAALDSEIKPLKQRRDDARKVYQDLDLKVDKIDRQIYELKCEAVNLIMPAP